MQALAEAGRSLRPLHCDLDIIAWALWRWRDDGGPEKAKGLVAEARELLRGGRLSGARRVGSTLSATIGSYSVAAEFEGRAVPDDWAAVRCTCPAGQAAVPACKHALALLLHQAAEPGLRAGVSSECCHAGGQGESRQRPPSAHGPACMGRHASTPLAARTALLAPCVRLQGRRRRSRARLGLRPWPPLPAQQAPQRPQQLLCRARLPARRPSRAAARSLHPYEPFHRSEPRAGRVACRARRATRCVWGGASHAASPPPPPPSALRRLEPRGKRQASAATAAAAKPPAKRPKVDTAANQAPALPAKRW